MISHGSVGSLSGHKDTAEALARAGFVVAALTHPGDNFRDPSRTWRLTDRPPQVGALIDYLTGDWTGAATVDSNRIGAFGFTAGGYTVTTLIGGQSSAPAIVDHCAAHADQLLCRLIGPGGIDVASWRASGRDDRIKAAVIAAPGFGFAFSDDSLRGVRVPVQLWQAGADQILAAPYHVEPLRDRLPAAEYHRVDGALHHDFMAPCPPEMAQALPDLCRSNPGFDRAAFKVDFNREVVRFFEASLTATPR
ncbi:MAG: dienelactone hydrolase [Caulobacter sp.]|nr:dienelactone hydrolase [Caulobacter sp.]